MESDALKLTELLERKRARLPADTTAFRWVDFELDDVTIDVFGDVAVVSLYAEWHAEREELLCREAVALAKLRAAYLKRRPKEAKRKANELGDWVAPPQPIAGTPVDSLEFVELGVKYEARPSNGLSVGLYLDARDARGWVRRESSGKSVLNLFAYTCGFGLLARLGGARRAVNVDLSRKVLDWGAHNYALNGVSVDQRDFVSGDSFEWLKRFAKKGDRFDLIVLDPPSFATSGKNRFLVGKDYPRLVESAAAALNPGGRVLACCNLAQASMEEVASWVKRGGLTPTGEQFGASDADYQVPSALKVIVAEA